MNQIQIYKSTDNKVEIKLGNETVWLNQYQLVNLFESSRSNIVEHIKNIYNSKELDDISICRKFRQVQQEGKRMVDRER